MWFKIAKKCEDFLSRANRDKTKKEDMSSAQRKEVIKEAVQRTVSEYGETLKRLGNE